MKILVLSDSHAGLSFMRRCIDAVRPDRVIHLGDYYDDGLPMAEEYPEIPMLLMPGNCDKYRCPPGTTEIRTEQIGGVDFYMTHGHRSNVKLYLGKLLADARACRADIALFGHTHEAYLEKEEDGLWVMNPGTSGSWSGSAGLIEIRDKAITACRILRQSDLEGMV